MMKIFAVLLFLLYSITPLSAADTTYDMTLYYSPRCPHSQKVLSYLTQTGLKIPMKNVLQDRQAKKELQESGGFMIVPCLVVNGKAIYDASDIIQWLSTHEKNLDSLHN
jgi:glutaredoxin